MKTIVKWRDRKEEIDLHKTLCNSASIPGSYIHQFLEKQDRFGAPAMAWRLPFVLCMEDTNKAKRQLIELCNAKKETILLVDDEERVVDVEKEMLKALGYEVLVAKGGAQAIELYNEHLDAIDMVLLDVIMPEMSGSKTYDLMKEVNPAVKVLLSSGYSVEGQATEILERGCNGFIQKPFNVEQLSLKIREIIEHP